MATAKSTPKKAPGRRTPILRTSDIRTIVRDLAERMAPGDVADVLAHERQLRAQAAELRSNGLPLLRAQLELALDVLSDHLSGECPQIPYSTISLLAAAVCYYYDELDVIPDFLPGIGKLDDAAVMAMACQLAVDGLRRYCDWKGRSLDQVLNTAIHGPRKKK